VNLNVINDVLRPVPSLLAHAGSVARVGSKSGVRQGVREMSADRSVRHRKVAGTPETAAEEVEAERAAPLPPFALDAFA
jgi:hypothetical protein